MSLKRSIATGVAVLTSVSLSFAAAPAFADSAPNANTNSLTSPYVKGYAYSQGWYKNHPSQWPCSFDPNTPFFYSGLTWIQVLDASSKDGVYYQLAQQAIAAYMNMENGAVPTPEVWQAFLAAGTYFMTASPTDPLTKDQNAQLKSYISTLESFNLGTSVASHDGAMCQVGMARELKIRQ